MFSMQHHPVMQRALPPCTKSADSPHTRMNQIIAIMKRRPKVQQLLREGAVIKAYIDNLFLGSNTTEDHKALIDTFLSVCDECNTRVKIQKCEFMREVVEYLGFEVGYQFWKSVEDEVVSLVKVTIRDHPVQGVKDIQAFCKCG